MEILEQVKAYVEENGRPEFGPRNGEPGEKLNEAVESGIITQEQADTVTEVMAAIKAYAEENGLGFGMKGNGPRGDKGHMGPRGGEFPGQFSGNFIPMGFGLGV